MPNITEENRELYIYIGKLHRALCNAMDTVDNIYDNGENCPYCGFEYPFTCEDGVAECTCYTHEDCEGNEAQNLLNEVNEVCGEGIKAVGQGTLNIK